VKETSQFLFCLIFFPLLPINSLTSQYSPSHSFASAAPHCSFLFLPPTVDSTQPRARFLAPARKPIPPFSFSDENRAWTGKHELERRKKMSRRLRKKQDGELFAKAQHVLPLDACAHKKVSRYDGEMHLRPSTADHHSHFPSFMQSRLSQRRGTKNSEAN
jgi:hypothetical protein